MKFLNIDIKTLFFSCLFVITFLGVKLQAEHYDEQPYRSYDYPPEDQNYYKQGEYYENRYRRPMYRNREDYPLIGAGASSQGIGANVGPIGVGIGSPY